MFAGDHVPFTSSLESDPPVIVIAPPGTEELMFVKLMECSPLEDHTSDPVVPPLPRVRLPRVVLTFTSSVHVPMMRTFSLDAGSAPPLHLVVSLQLPGPVNVRVTATVVTTDENGDEPSPGVVQLTSE